MWLKVAGAPDVADYEDVGLHGDKRSRRHPNSGPDKPQGQSHGPTALSPPTRDGPKLPGSLSLPRGLPPSPDFWDSWKIYERQRGYCGGNVIVEPKTIQGDLYVPRHQHEVSCLKFFKNLKLDFESRE